MPDDSHQAQDLSSKSRPEVIDGPMAKKRGTASGGVMKSLLFKKVGWVMHGVSFGCCIQRLLVNATVGSDPLWRNRMLRNWVLHWLQNSACRDGVLTLPSPHARPEL